MMGDFRLYLNKPVYPVVHAEFFYRFNGIEYKKFPIDVREDICEWIVNRNRTGWINEKKVFFSEWALGKILPFANLNQNCPYIGEIYMQFKNISLEQYFIIPQFLPAGRFRIDVYFIVQGKVCFSAKIYFAISDHRIERF